MTHLQRIAFVSFVLGFVSVFVPGCMLARPKNISGAAAKYVAPPERCAALDDRQSVWGAVGAGAGLLAGGSGLTTIATQDNGARLAFAITSGVMGALAAASEFFARDSSQKFVHEGCAGEAVQEPLKLELVGTHGASDAGVKAGADADASKVQDKGDFDGRP